MMMHLSSACGKIVAIAVVLATRRVDGFSATPRMPCKLLEGYRNGGIHTKYRTFGRTHQQLYMCDDDDDSESDDDISAADDAFEPTSDAVSIEANEEVLVEEREVSEEKEEEEGMDAAVAIDETEEAETNDYDKGDDESDIDAVAIDEIEEEESATAVIDERDVLEEEKETIEEDEDVDESETTTAAIDETEDTKEELELDSPDGIEEELEGTNEDSKTAAVALDRNDAEEGEAIEEDDEGTVESETTIVAAAAIDETEKVENDATEDAGSAMFFATQGSTDTIKEDDKNDGDGDGDTRQDGLNLEMVAMVVGDIANDLLSVLRFGAANFLTASLPEDQREDLLKRMGTPALSAASTSTATQSSSDTVIEVTAEAAAEIVSLTIEEERASIQEEIAVARAEEAQKSERKWEKEKEDILVDMEQAANARVENELKIQKMKLEEETAKALLEKDQGLLAEIKRLEAAIEDEQTKAAATLEALEAEIAKALEADEDEDDVSTMVDDLFAVGTDEEVARNEVLDALLEKRKSQQAALEALEEELRLSVANEEEQRDLLQKMLVKRQGQQEELNTVEANLRKQVRHIESEKARYEQLTEGLKAMKEKAAELQEEDETTTTTDDDIDEAEVAGDKDSESAALVVHPVLGPVVADLGYKRIHLVSSGRLGTIPVWNRNRTYRNNRAKSMAAEKIKSMELGFPGVIGLHEASSGKLSIVDGQHRVGMMAALKETVNKKIEKGDDIGTWMDTAAFCFDRVLVEVYPEPEDSPPAEGDAFAEKVFLEINKAEPVKLIDMPGVASAADRQVITEAVEILQEQFGAMFSPSQRCRVPNVNVDNLRSIVFGANILKRHKVTTSKKLVEWLLEQNAALGDEYENDTKKQKLVSKKQWMKASGNTFYLGLESSWLYK